MRAAVTIAIAVCLAGCSGATPGTANRTSASFPTLTERIEFLERYVTFRRQYQELDFAIAFRDGGRGLPGPSEYDVRLVAHIPPEELGLWVPTGVEAAASAETNWLSTVPQSEKAAGITEWYVEPRRMIGLDRQRAVVAYRVWAN